MGVDRKVVDYKTSVYRYSKPYGGLMAYGRQTPCPADTDMVAPNICRASKNTSELQGVDLPMDQGVTVG